MRQSRLQRSHLVVALVVRQLGEAERLEQRRQIDAKAAPKPLLEPVPAAYRVVCGPSPRLDGPLGCRLLLVGAAERHPVAVRLQHGVQVVDRAQLVPQLGRADLAHERRWIPRGRRGT